VTQSIETPISHIDIIPTLLDLQGVSGTVPTQGISVFAPQQNRPLFFHAYSIVKQYGALYWPWKYLYTLHPETKEELYNLSIDQGETDNLADNTYMLRYFHQLTKEWAASQIDYYEKPDLYLQYVPFRYRLKKEEPFLHWDGPDSYPEADSGKSASAYPPQGRSLP
jgi:arylsulfatase A-like enzyme